MLGRWSTKVGGGGAARIANPHYQNNVEGSLGSSCYFLIYRLEELKVAIRDVFSPSLHTRCFLLIKIDSSPREEKKSKQI